MEPDPLKHAWQSAASQGRLTIDAELFLNEVRRNQQSFAATIFWRDLREVVVGIVMVPLWLYLGIRLSLPWAWYLAVPGLLWVVGYLLVDRRRHARKPTEPDEPLRRHVQDSLERVEHQIGLLRRVFWWYLLPLGLPILAFFGQIAWRSRSLGWQAILFFSFATGFVLIVFAGIYWLNQAAVRAALEPRRRELETLLRSLEDEPPVPG
jgi:hypothetical protein